MLWSIAALVVLLWLLGALAIPGTGEWVHLLLIVAIVIIVAELVRGRRA